MVGYLLGNTVTEHGHVARGICEEDKDGYLLRVTERHPHRARRDRRPVTPRTRGGAGAIWPGTPSWSMNLWGLFPAASWTRPGPASPAYAALDCKGEYFLPGVVTQLLEEGKARVKVLRSHDKWYGVTYQEDKPAVMAALADKTAQGLYPDDLWG